MMSRRDYEGVAREINSAIRHLERWDGANPTETVYTLAEGLAELFGQGNMRFKNDVFIAACLKGTELEDKYGPGSNVGRD